MSAGRKGALGSTDRGSGTHRDAGAPVIAGVVIETHPGRAPELACRLGGREDLTVIGGDGDRRLAALWKAGSARRLERATQDFVLANTEVIGVFPTFVGEHDTTDGTRADSTNGGAFDPGGRTTEPRS